MNPEYIIYAVAAVALIAGLVFLAIYMAPEGYQDEQGFHRGTQDKDA